MHITTNGYIGTSQIHTIVLYKFKYSNIQIVKTVLSL